MTFGFLKKAMATVLAAITLVSFAMPAQAQWGPPRHHYGYGPGPGPHHYYGPGPSRYYYGPGPYYRPGPRGYYYRRDRGDGAAAAVAIMGLAAGAAIASQSRRCWIEQRRVRLDSGRRVWRDVRVCR
ncbi:hypothetical protein [Blastochloris viridis]|uniref:Transmembrane protein n=1 Tax=Blastochloris viridis TaxID=1079 RepID=A0A0H5BK35_BLAVI|nr:hypothetical protein [Blastochloris viridis]ALK09226.1 hypothetical protein BVIR_1443 [Blastochloris viridis]BAS00907.1 hypothetical protein BV133_3313 [Blastochloris viridis]CUU41889.1 hypothetical protein BVIRIDIS_08880 [Blastochloris viridis]